MTEFSFLLLHVENPATSAVFYKEELGLPIVDQSATFAALPLRDGVMLGLWSGTDVEPASSGQTGAIEIAFTAENAAAVDAMHADWQQRGLAILQAPTRMSFGQTFTACDPYGHRIRIFSPMAD